MSTIHFRAASIEDLDLLCYWDEKPHNFDADPDSDWAWETELKRQPVWREQLIAELDGRPLGFVQIIDPAEEESQYWGDVAPHQRAIDMWIGEEEDLGKGYGTIMMQLALSRCFEQTKVSAVLIDPLETNKRAIRFYEKIGFDFQEKQILEGDACLVYKMTRSKWEQMKNKHK